MSTSEFGDVGRWEKGDIAHEIGSAVPRKPLIARGAIRSTESVDMGDGWCFRCVLADHTGELYLLFMGRREVAGFRPGTICTVQGTVGKDGDTLTLWNPLYRLEPTE
jgi:hypothetical protein